jgi:hypothetical protein
MAKPQYAFLPVFKLQQHFETGFFPWKNYLAARGAFANKNHCFLQL